MPGGAHKGYLHDPSKCVFPVRLTVVILYGWYVFYPVSLLCCKGCLLGCFALHSHPIICIVPQADALH